MNRKILILSFLILHFTFYIRLSAEDTWVQTYQPFQWQWWTDSYTVEDVIVAQDGGYEIIGFRYLIEFDR